MRQQVLRLATAGSVDDGKSTLVGRLLCDSRAVLVDQLAAVERASRDRGLEAADLALLTDGLRAEREQGITIDVAYRAFATPRRAFLLADTPGHVQYTRNMVTGASTAELVVVLADVRKGVLDQTRRHAAIAALLQVDHVVLAVNKMDLVGFDQSDFERVAKEFVDYARMLGVPDVAKTDPYSVGLSSPPGRPSAPLAGRVVAIPISALLGDNVVLRSEPMDWYEGPTLLAHLETVPVRRDPCGEAFRLPVQTVIRPRSARCPDYRAYAGRIEAGAVAVGDRVLVQPAGITTTVTAIDTFDGPLEQAWAPRSVALRLANDLDVSRGALLSSPAAPAAVTRDLAGTVCWLATSPAVAGSRVLVRAGTALVRGVLASLDERLDITTLEREPSPASLELNAIAAVSVRLDEPLALDPYAVQRRTGAFLLVDEADGTTLAAGMVGGLPAPRGAGT